MSKYKSDSVSFINKDQFSESFDCNIETSLGDVDNYTLIQETEKQIKSFKVIKTFINGILVNHLKLFIIICDIFCIFIFTLLLQKINKLGCINFKTKEILEWCTPYDIVNKVIVDLNFDLLVHCDTPKSCIAYAEIMMEKQGFNYNFIIGDEDLVYVGKGFQCKSDTLRLQMLITRYTWDPKKPIYKIPHEVVIRYTEIIQEGLQCGKISQNFTVSANCSVYGEWCGATEIQENIPWTKPIPMAFTHQDRNPWYEQPHGDHPFFSFDVERVYDGQYKLKVCNTTRE